MGVLVSQGICSIYIAPDRWRLAPPHKRDVKRLCDNKTETRQRRQGQMEEGHNEREPGEGMGVVKARCAK